MNQLKIFKGTSHEKMSKDVLQYVLNLQKVQVCSRDK